MLLDSWSVGHAKYHVYNPGRPGSSLKLFFEKIPRRIIESAVKNMLPNGRRQKFYKSNSTDICSHFLSGIITIVLQSS